ncbi:related to YAP1802-Yeast Adaptor Protein, member of AP180 protein family [Phialocephala subalpina]|uniref:Related to YAP1802-Yeast Adaptor Protein, member of AP180 protein family n=1 Tax=Phialocephala subalpina TaxID=576137 RepID=A0A1L7WSI9_9HELO|nr:related to YAP1802-Yeast Adaptor Protein, member of AP180 protein family [Phialocephala subalpina]
MASSFEKSVKGATKIKAAPPKSKYIEHILIATHSGENGVAEVFRALQNRLRDSTWTVVFKSLITVHLMIREGSPDVTLAYLARHRSMLAIGSFSDVQTQGRNIRHYTNYLMERARAYRDTKCDFVRGAENRLEKMTVDKGLLRETEAVQHQITALLKCDVLENEPENEITITVFRMLVLDLLAMFHVMNQAMINILGHFFEMSKPDAERAMEIYNNFTKQTDFVVQYLSIARQYEHQTRVEVPKLKHAPVNLGKQLQEYLKDEDFEINRRQYLAEQESKKNRTNGSSTNAFSKPAKSDAESRAATGRAFPDATNQSATKTAAPAKGPDPDLIDFFDSIEQNQQPMATQPGMQQAAPQFNGFQMQQPQQFQQNGFAPQQTGFQNPNQFSPQQQQQPFNTGFNGVQQQLQQQPQPIQTNFTGAGFGGYSPQPSFQPGGLSSIPQDSAVNFQQQMPQQQPQQHLGPMQTGAQQTTNPFRQSMMANPAGMQGPSFPASPPVTSPITRQSTNPFAKHTVTAPPVQPVQPFSPPPDQQYQQMQPQQTAAPLRPMATGTNPFAKNLAMNAAQRPQTSTGLVPQPTGSTNPFRQSQFVNTATGTGWQHNQQPMGGGLDSLETVPVFPRPAQQQAWQQ